MHAGMFAPLTVGAIRGMVLYDVAFRDRRLRPDIGAVAQISGKKVLKNGRATHGGIALQPGSCNVVTLCSLLRQLS